MCRTSCSVGQAYGPLTVTHRYPFFAKSWTHVPEEYPIRGKSSARVLHVKLKPITVTTNIQILMIPPHGVRHLALLRVYPGVRSRQFHSHIRKEFVERPAICRATVLC